MTRFGFFALALILAPVGAVPLPAGAQGDGPCAGEQSGQFDFWLGEWDVTWEGGSGTNQVSRTLDGCVIEENFAGELPSGMLLGHSVTAFDRTAERWRQTWVDNQGGYLLFSGGVDDEGIMRLYGSPRSLPDGRTRQMRMSWVDVGPDAFDWHWESSFDGGRTWEMAWEIHYTRR
jgi:hypothetical protein